MRPRRGHGFTLVETIFSTLFIGVAVLAIVNLFPGAYLSIRRSETQLQADFVAKSVIDELRLTRMSDLDENYTPPDTAPFTPWEVDGIEYTPAVEIYEVPGAQPDFIKGVRVTVTYRLGVRTDAVNEYDVAQKKVIHETYLHKLVR